MARDSLTAAKAELFGFLVEDDLPLIDGVAAMFDHHPARGAMRKPITVTVTPAGVGPDEWTFAVRVYASIEVDAQQVEGDLEAVVTDIEAALSDRWGPSNWTIDPHPLLEETILAEWLVTVGREDED